MRVAVIADFIVIFGNASLTLRNHFGSIIQLAHALLFGMVILGFLVALTGPIDNRIADLLALLRDFVCFQVGKGPDNVGEQNEAGEAE